MDVALSVQIPHTRIWRARSTTTVWPVRSGWVKGGLLGVTSIALVAMACSSGTEPREPAGRSTEPTTTAEANSGDTELAAVPPMGWNSWNQVRCYDLTEEVVRSTADAIVSLGLREAGYQYVVVDDCWQAPTRDAAGLLQADPDRFPSGIEALAEYVHDLELDFGLYLAPGTKTCAMTYDDYPGEQLGSLGHETDDAQLIAKWGVDYLKYDWCGADENDGLERVAAFTQMRDELHSTGRPIVYSISEYGATQPWTWAPGIANLWRTTSDILPIWGVIAAIIDSQSELHPFSGPGGWNDPDMLQVGNGPLSDVENRSHFTMWAMLAAPLMLGTDLAAASPDLISVITNDEVIAIDQDPLGQQAQRIRSDSETQVWARPLDGGEFAVALLNSGETPVEITASLEEVGATEGSWTARDLWSHEDLGPVSQLTSVVEPHGVTLIRLTRQP